LPQGGLQVQIGGVTARNARASFPVQSPDRKLLPNGCQVSGRKASHRRQI